METPFVSADVTVFASDLFAGLLATDRLTGYNRGMIVRQLHDWQLSIPEAVALQTRLASRISREDAAFSVNYIAGVDVSAPKSRGEGAAAVVILDYPGLKLVETKTVRGDIDFPYVPGLLTFREAPLVLRAFEQVNNVPALVFIDGQGIAHPRRFGIAAHIGLILDIPTIGCAKSRLCGTHEEPGLERGSFSDLVDGDETIGVVLRTKTGIRPLFISVGHKISLRQATEWVLVCCKGYRLPEPARLAHQAAGGHLALDKLAAAV
jgi:deoxyribonuclease V